ncbi:hypothetical protein [Aquimarina rhabdastrellae]
MKEMITSKLYWKSVMITGIMFAVVFSIIMFLINHGFDFESFQQTKLAEGRWKRYIVSRIVGGFVYGLFMGFVSFKKSKEKAK